MSEEAKLEAKLEAKRNSLIWVNSQMLMLHAVVQQFDQLSDGYFRTDQIQKIYRFKTLLHQQLQTLLQTLQLKNDAFLQTLTTSKRTNDLSHIPHVGWEDPVPLAYQDNEASQEELLRRIQKKKQEERRRIVQQLITEKKRIAREEEAYAIIKDRQLHVIGMTEKNHSALRHPKKLPDLMQILLNFVQAYQLDADLVISIDKADHKKFAFNSQSLKYYCVNIADNQLFLRKVEQLEQGKSELARKLLKVQAFLRMVPFRKKYLRFLKLSRSVEKIQKYYRRRLAIKKFKRLQQERRSRELSSFKLLSALQLQDLYQKKHLEVIIANVERPFQSANSLLAQVFRLSRLKKILFVHPDPIQLQVELFLRKILQTLGLPQQNLRMVEVKMVKGSYVELSSRVYYLMPGALRKLINAQKCPAVIKHFSGSEYIDRLSGMLQTPLASRPDHMTVRPSPQNKYPGVHDIYSQDQLVKSVIGLALGHRFQGFELRPQFYAGKFGYAQLRIDIPKLKSCKTSQQRQEYVSKQLSYKLILEGEASTKQFLECFMQGGTLYPTMLNSRSFAVVGTITNQVQYQGSLQLLKKGPRLLGVRKHVCPKMEQSCYRAGLRLKQRGFQGQFWAELVLLENGAWMEKQFHSSLSPLISTVYFPAKYFKAKFLHSSKPMFNQLSLCESMKLKGLEFDPISRVGALALQYEGVAQKVLLLLGGRQQREVEAFQRRFSNYFPDLRYE